jgi:1-acyl-sn-glycerol-3-phosphate acyltransferase
MTAMTTAEPVMTPVYRAVVALTAPVMLRWARLRVTGEEVVPVVGPVVVVADHDSYWDPIAIAVAARRRRQIRALSKSTLWRNPVLGRLMDAMGHIPVERGVSNEAALARAIEELLAGACIGMFPEGTRSLGRELRARSGVGRLAAAVPEATVVCARTSGTTGLVRLPRRPTVTVDFSLPARPGADESPAAHAQRLLDELRDGAPREIPGRRRTARKFAARLEQRTAGS